MGCVSSCFRVVDDDEEHENPEPPVFRYCFCLRCSTLAQQLYTVLFRTGGVSVVSTSVQGITSLSGVAEDSSISDSYRAPPRPLPYDDPRCSRLHCQYDGLASRGDKASTHVHDESEPLLRGRNVDTEYPGTVYKLNGSYYEGNFDSCMPESSLKFPYKELTSGITYVFSSSEDEDVCPICLEEYTAENPRITLQCSHHFHLSCIYEWMERSETCPVCGKVMVFNEEN